MLIENVHPKIQHTIFDPKAYISRQNRIIQSEGLDHKRSGQVVVLTSSSATEAWQDMQTSSHGDAQSSPDIGLRLFDALCEMVDSRSFYT
jgi:hypothetical protein